MDNTTVLPPADRNSGIRIIGGGRLQILKSSKNTRKKSISRRYIATWLYQSPHAHTTPEVDADVDNEKDGQLHIYPWFMLDWSAC